MILIDEKKHLQLLKQASQLTSRPLMEQFLLLMKEAYQVDRIFFCATGIDYSDLIDGIGNYPLDWADFYSNNDMHVHDPILRHLRNLKPVIWSDMTNLTQLEQFLMTKSAEYGVGPHGMTFPFRSSDLSTSLLSITESNTTSEAWYKKATILRKEFREIGEILHSAYLSLAGLTPPAIDLSPRLMECLKLKGTGLNEEEIAQVLDISVYSVKQNLKHARLRLKAKNNEQAIATAMSIGLITFDR